VTAPRAALSIAAECKRERSLCWPPFIAFGPGPGGEIAFHCGNSHLSGNLPKQILAISTMVRGGPYHWGVKSGIILDFLSIGQGVIFRGFWMATSDLGGFGVNFPQLWGP